MKKFNLFFLNIIPVVLMHFAFLIFWLVFKGDSNFITDITVLETNFNILIIPILLVVINIINCWKNKQYKFTIYTFLMLLMALLGNLLHYFNWGISTGHLFNPDFETLIWGRSFLLASFCTTLLLGVLAQLILLVKKRVEKGYKL